MKQDYQKEIALRDEIIQSLQHERNLQNKLIEKYDDEIRVINDEIYAMQEEIMIKNRLIEYQEKEIELHKKHEKELTEMMKNIFDTLPKE